MAIRMQRSEPGRVLLSLTLSAACLCGCGDRQANKIGEMTAESARSATRAMSVAAEHLGKAASKLKEQVGEAELTGKVFARLHWDKQLQSVKIAIDSQPGGVVVLTGNVASETVRSRIIELAANTVGVREVRDVLRVTGEIADERSRTESEAKEELPLMR
jgi:osmotically-inducible protein OsmY